MSRDVVWSTLRYLVHGGGVGTEDQFVMDAALSRFSDPHNRGAPHPLLEKLTAYHPNTSFDCYPRKFFYEKGARKMIVLPPKETQFITALLGQEVSGKVFQSKQFVVDAHSFSIGDVVSVVAGDSPAKRFV